MQTFRTCYRLAIIAATAVRAVVELNVPLPLQGLASHILGPADESMVAPPEYKRPEF
jgi:hypothetical protein